LTFSTGSLQVPYSYIQQSVTYRPFRIVTLLPIVTKKNGYKVRCKIA
jgi:hypothetical protein